MKIIKMSRDKEKQRKQLIEIEEKIGVIIKVENDNAFVEPFKKKYQCDMFGGDNCEQLNAMMTALVHASEADGHNDNEKIYKFLDTSKTMLIVSLVDALNEAGYQITRK